jgi:molybdopterin-guanine dinucleotide biosynthesis protein A
MKVVGQSAAGSRAVILAGGEGTRLKPFSVNFPKPLVPLGETPVIEILIQPSPAHLKALLRSYGGRLSLLAAMMFS